MTYIRWLAGAECFRLEALVPWGQRHRDVKLEVSAQELIDAADALPRGASSHDFAAEVKHGRGRQTILVPLDSSRLRAIAELIRGVPASEVGHRFYHYEYPGTPFPCESCAVTIEGKQAAADRALSRFVRRWARRLGAEPASIMRLLREYGDLPRGRLTP